MSKPVFDQISEGINEALAVAKGESTPFGYHFSDPVDVKATQIKTGWLEPVTPRGAEAAKPD